MIGRGKAIGTGWSNSTSTSGEQQPPTTPAATQTRGTQHMHVNFYRGFSIPESIKLSYDSE